MARDSFEIYYFQNGRWSVHASFEGNQRDLAMAEAQKVDKTLGFPVRLVRETFDPESNTSEEVVSWQSPKAKQMGDADSMFGSGAAAKAPNKSPSKKKPQPKASPPPPKRKEERAEAPPAPAPKKVVKKAPPPKRKSKKKRRGFLTKAAYAALRGLIVSAVIVGAVWFALYVAVERMHAFPLSGDDTQTVLAALFVVTYAVSAIYFLFKEFDIRLGWRRKSKAQARDASHGASDMLRRMRENQVAADVANADVGPEPAITEADVEALREQIAQEEAEESGDRTGADDFGTAVHEESAEAAPEPPPEPPQPESAPAKADKPAEPAPTPEEKKPEEKKAPEKPQVSPAESEARQGLVAFAREALAAATREQPQMNAFSRFGLNLYVAGACSIIGQAKKLGRAAQLMLLRDSLQAAGNTPERAENFCAELPSHAKNQRYSGMIQAGSAAMTRQLSGQPANTQELTNLLAEWTKPEKRPSVPSSFTFLFTDIVNSTALTSQLGNAGAQRVVRAHNQAVRGAIQAYQGREVKHTGDGIMATFPTPLAAVQAAIRAQKEIVAHSAANPSVAFSVRIGINVGEAVEEDNDFFGAAVQMTARICSVATAGNAWVSRAVVDACKGQRIGFIPRGAFQMKGIQQARPLYEVAYTDAHKNEIANL